MRGLKVAALFLVIALLFVWGCDRKTTVINAPSNISGDCFTCHSDQDFALNQARQYYNLSLHATGTTYLRSTVPCADCHTNEGFVNLLETGTEIQVDDPTHISCFTCHAPHTNGSLKLRTEAPVTLMVSGATFDMGEGNLCANCHQARIASPDIVGDTVKITSSHWGLHHGPQANILSGNGAYLLPGVTSYPKNGHATAITNGCPTCHMASITGVEAGSHTFNVSYETTSGTQLVLNGCISCHPSINQTDVQDEQELVVAKIDSLQALLVTAGYVKANGSLNVPTGDTLRVPLTDAKVIANWLLMDEDRSEGVHNMTYVNAVLDAAIDYMNTELE